MDNEMRKLGVDFSEKELRPVWEALGAADATLLEKLLGKAAAAGIFGFAVPEAAGGSGLGAAEYSVFLEEVSKASGGIGMLFAAHFAGIAPLLIAGGENALQLLSGVTAAEGAGEPHLFAAAAVKEGKQSEYDTCHIETYIKRDGDARRVTGVKTKVVGAAAASGFTVLARDEEDGILYWAAVPSSAAGVTVRPETGRLGLRICPINDVEFSGAEVPATNVIAKVSDDDMMRYHRFIDPVFAAVAIGMAVEARDSAMKYSIERYQGGKMICDHDAVRSMLSGMDIQLRAARSLAYGPEAGYIASAFASAAAEQCCVDAVQVFGGYGYTKEYRVERILRDVKTFRAINSSLDRARKHIDAEIGKMNRGHR